MISLVDGAVRPYDLAVIIDPVDKGAECAGDIDCSEHTLIIQKAMGLKWSAVTIVVTHDLAVIVDPKSKAPTNGAGGIKCDEHTLVMQKAVKPKRARATSAVIPHDLAVIIDPNGIGVIYAATPLGISIVVKVYEASWAATRVLSRTLRDSTADSRERRMGGPLSVHGGRVSTHRKRRANLSEWAEKV
jgi:archaellum component FlaG (FlaF/FlaG flagellin family)